MSDYRIHGEDRVIGGALFDLRTSFSKGRGYYAYADPAKYETLAGVTLKSVSMSLGSSGICLKKATRFNRSAGEALIPQAQAAYRELILKIVRKEVSDRGLWIGFEAQNGVKRFHAALAQFAADGEPIPEFHFPFPAQNDFVKCKTLLELVLDGKMTVPDKATEGQSADLDRYGGILMFLEPFDDAKKRLIEAGKGFGDERAVEMIQKWEALHGPVEVKAQMEDLLVNLMMSLRPQNVAA